jgi:hypothetical protein
MVLKPGNIVAIDLVGPFPEEIDGSLYGLVIHNLFSRMTLFYGIKSKADAPTEVMKWVGTFEKHSGYSVMCIRSDNAGEFISDCFNVFLDLNYIRHEMSIPLYMSITRTAALRGLTGLSLIWLALS